MAKTDMLEGEFLRELRRIKGWGTCCGLLRKTAWPCECPVAAVANNLIGSHFTSLDWKLAAWAIGLPESFALKVVNAADDLQTRIPDPKLRARLLEACGLVKEQPHGTA